MPKVDLSDMDIQALIDDEDGALDNGHLPMRAMHDDDAIDRDHAVVTTSAQASPRWCASTRATARWPTC